MPCPPKLVESGTDEPRANAVPLVVRKHGHGGQAHGDVTACAPVDLDRGEEDVPDHLPVHLRDE